MNSNLPAGWVLMPLYQRLDAVRTTVRLDQIRPDDIYVGLEHVSSATGEYRGVLATEAGIKSGKFRFQPGDILYGKLRPNLRKCIVARESGVCSTDLMPLRPFDPEAAFLLALQLRSENLTEAVMRRISGANLPRINVKDLLGLEVPVPSAADRIRVQEAAKRVTRVRSSLRTLEEGVVCLEAASTALALGQLGHAAEPASVG